jgi:ATPase subunit of ABC transporter with duplicated ATPase domains
MGQRLEKLPGCDATTLTVLYDVGIQEYKGGLVLVSHDFRLIDQVAEQIWVCDQKKVTTWKGDIRAYKEHLKRGMKL